MQLELKMILGTVLVTVSILYNHLISIYLSRFVQVNISPIVILLTTEGYGCPQGDIIEYTQNTRGLEAVLVSLPGVSVINESTTCGLINPQVEWLVSQLISCQNLSDCRDIDGYTPTYQVNVISHGRLKIS